MRREADLLALEEQREPVARSFEIGDHGLTALEHGLGAELAERRELRETVLADGSPRVEEGAPAPPLDARGVQLLAERVEQAVGVLAGDVSAQRDVVLARAQRVSDRVEPRVLRDPQREVKRVGVRRLGVVQPAPRQVERVSGTEREFLHGVAVLAQPWGSSAGA